MIKLASPDISQHEHDALTKILESGWLSSAPIIQKFEDRIAELCSVKHAVAVNSGTSALYLALKALNIGKGDEVIVPAFTFIATAYAVEMVGAKAVLVDVDPQSWNIDSKEVSKAISDKTKAIIPVDQFGLPVDIKALKKFGLPIIEDAACALGATRHQTIVGSDAEMTCFSFHPRKVITTGEGGMVITQNENHATTLRMLRSHGRDASGIFSMAAGNLRMSAMAAALGNAQLDRIDSFISTRKSFAQRYIDALSSHDQISFQALDNGHIYQTFAIWLRDPALNRNQIIDRLKTNAVEANIATHAVHAFSPFKERYRLDNFPISKDLAENALALPLHTKMTLEDIDQVCDIFLAAIKD